MAIFFDGLVRQIRQAGIPEIYKNQEKSKRMFLGASKLYREGWVPVVRKVFDPNPAMLEVQSQCRFQR